VSHAKYQQPRKTWRYPDKFKATAVQLSLQDGIQVKAVAESLDIHPFMLSRWRKEYREGKIVVDKRRKVTGVAKDKKGINGVRLDIHKACLRTPKKTQARQVSFFQVKCNASENHVDGMKNKIDSDTGREMITRRFANVEPVFGNLCGNKRLHRFTLRGKTKVDGRWKLYCMMPKLKSGQTMVRRDERVEKGPTHRSIA
jgi:transposase-like protein